MTTAKGFLLSRLLLVAVSAGLVLVLAEAADGWKGPCIAGKTRPICNFSKGKVTFVADGDTLDVDVFGDGTSRPLRVRITGINAMEQSVYSKYPSRRRGACHSLAATARLERLVKLSRRVVRLGSQARDPRAGRRHRRSVAVRLSGRWRDTGQMLINQGHVLWLPNRGEWARNTPYNFGAQRAAAARLRLWDTDSCRSGPHQSTPLRMWVNWDADGRDGRGNSNGEWVRIKNQGATDLPIGRWWFRDSWLKRFTFPSGAAVPAGGTITLFVGSRPSRDRNRSTHFYWGRSAAMFENVNLVRGFGDGGYLFDPHGDLRLWMTYPCRYRCGDPLRGKIRLTARRSAPEEVQVRNASSGSVNLEGYVIGSHPWIYSFPASTLLDPGETLRLVVIGSRANDTRLVKYWGKSRAILNDGGDRVLLRTQRNVRIACYSWGSASC